MHVMYIFQQLINLLHKSSIFNPFVQPIDLSAAFKVYLVLLCDLYNIYRLRK